MKAPAGALALVLLSASLPSEATVVYRAGVIESIQLESDQRGNTANLVWLRLPGSWPGVSCNSDWGWFDGKSNPNLLAAALTAKATGSPLTVYVDDGLEKKNGYCQITVLTL